METLPSKDLVEGVLNIKIEKVLKANKDYELSYKIGGAWVGTINIYELAHKCKEWARDNYYVNIMTYKKGAKYYVLENEFLNDENFEADTEYEAIFKACEWVLGHKK